MIEPTHPPLALVVDDDALFRLATSAALAKLGMRTIEACDGVEALEVFDREGADIVILDAQMPRLDGFEACRRLRESPQGAVVPVLMLTAHDDDVTIGRSWEAGATDFFPKPPRWSLLGQRVRFMLRAARLRADLDRSRTQSARAQRMAHLGHWEWDVASGRVEVSAECARLLGLANQPAVLDPAAFLACFHPSDRGLIAELAEACLPADAAEGPLVFECRIPVRPAPRIARLDVAFARAADGRLLRVNAVMQDVTERRMAEERVRTLASFDSLTGFANRGRFRELIGEAVESPLARAAVIVFDLRRLARVNGVLGDRAGDAVLREAATRVAAGLGAALERRPDVRGCAGRTAGDQFSVLLTGAVDERAAHDVAGRIVEMLGAPFEVAGREFIVRSNAGYALHPEDAREVDELLRRADEALARAKAARRPGTVLRAPGESEPPAGDTLALETALHHALDRRELLLHYQPQVDVRTGRIVSAEALMRWRRPEGLLGPGAFIGLAEESGLIESMEEWAILSACWQHRLWRESGQPAVPVAVNLSATHFLSPDLVRTVSTALAESGCPPAHLELEITETVLLRDLSLALPQMEALNELGVRIAIDDFGTGYSSLAYLRSLPIDRLKIDRSFVSEIGTSRDARGIVTAMLAMAKALGLKVLAEGVETEEQARCLAERGCPVMQGYWFAQPMAGDDFQALLAGARSPDWRLPRTVAKDPHRDEQHA